MFGPGVDEPIVEYDTSGNRTWLISDERGSIIARPDANGNMSSSRVNTYDEYGIPGSTNAGRYQYTGQFYLSEIGLDYYKNRIYSPTLGRFLQTDPIGYGDGINWYAYTHNNPVNGFDPLGLDDSTGAQLVCCSVPGGSPEVPVPGGMTTTVLGNWTAWNGTSAAGGGTFYDCGDFGCDIGIFDGWETGDHPGDGAASAAIAAIKQQLQAAARALKSQNECTAPTGKSAGIENTLNDAADGFDAGATAAAVTGQEEVAGPLEALSRLATVGKVYYQIERRDYLGGAASVASSLTSGLVGYSWKLLPAGDFAKNEFRQSASAVLGYLSGKGVDALADCK